MNMTIKVKNFKKQYHNHTVELEDIIISKRVNLIVGKNGSGKSTLLKAMANLIKYSGEIKNDNKICLMSEDVSYPRDLELDTFLMRLNMISYNKSSTEDIHSLLVSFNLIHKQHELLDSLSKGMKTKVNIVQCLMEKSDIYLLDEPLNGLDKEGVACLINYIKKSNKTFVISTHLATDFLKVSDEVFYL